MNIDPETVSLETRALLQAMQQAAGQAKSYRELEQIVHEHSQALARLQFNEQAVLLEGRLAGEKKDVRSATKSSR